VIGVPNTVLNVKIPFGYRNDWYVNERIFFVLYLFHVCKCLHPAQIVRDSDHDIRNKYVGDFIEDGS
jgi:hypothetical protein